MSTIDPNQFNIGPSPQDLVDDSFVNSTLGNTQGTSTNGTNQTETSTEPPQEKALDVYNDFTHQAQAYFNKEQSIGVPQDMLEARKMTSQLVGSVVANSTEALAAAAQTLTPAATLSLLQP